MSVLLRLVLVPLGIALAGLTALAVGLVGALVHGYGADLAGFAADTGLALVASAVTGLPGGLDPGGVALPDPGLLGGLLGVLWLVVVGIPFVPVALVALIGEALGIGSWMAYVLGTGALFSAVPALFPGSPAGEAASLPGWPEGAASGLAATGFAAGFVYWLVAGHGAPRGRGLRFDAQDGRPEGRTDGRLGDWSAPAPGASPDAPSPFGAGTPGRGSP